MPPTRSASTTTSVVLFTRDLRVHDQAGLDTAVRTSERVAPLFVIDDALIALLDSPSRVAFLVDSLRDLRGSLRRIGGDLIVRRGDPVEETLRLAHQVGAQTVFAASDVSGYAVRRQSRLARGCARDRLDLCPVTTTTAVAAGELQPGGGDHYRVFTPYWRRWQATDLGAPAPAPRRLRLPPGLAVGRIPSAASLASRAASPDIPAGGETAGRQRLTRWLANGIERYGQLHDDLAADATSRLSPYLHLGCLSAREIAHRARSHERAEPFLRQICWRDFFHQLLAANRRLPRDDLRPRGDRWSRDEEALERWRQGETGYPIVDAAMRQLAREGWMHNRARLIVGSFLTKTLYIDWRHGARVFSELLVDGDVANNVGNWQWIAGTGADTRPNRVLNPIVQARRFDPDGDYVRRYVPELAELAGRDLHEPWRASRAQVTPEYPAPIVDHDEASARFRALRRALRDAG